MIPDEVELMWSGGIAIGIWTDTRAGQWGLAVELPFLRLAAWWDAEPETF